MVIVRSVGLSDLWCVQPLRAYSSLPSVAPTADRRGVRGRVLRPANYRPNGYVSFRLNPNPSVCCENMKINKQRRRNRSFCVFYLVAGAGFTPSGMCSAYPLLLRTTCIRGASPMNRRSVDTKHLRCTLFAQTQVSATPFCSLFLSLAALANVPSGL